MIQLPKNYFNPIVIFSYFKSWMLALLLLSSFEAFAQKKIGKAIGGSGGEQFMTMAALPDGSYMLLGTTESTDGDITTKAAGSGDVWLVKTTAEGGLIWQKRYGGAGREAAAGLSIAPDGGFWVVATIDSLHGDVKAHYGKRDYWVLRLNAAGDILWQRTLGGKSHESAAGVLTLADGTCLVYGTTTSSDGDVQNSKGSMDIWLVALDGTGKTLWTKTLGGTASEWVSKVVQTSDGSLFVTGATISSNGDVANLRGASDAWLIKLDAKGTLQWAQTYGGTADDGFTDLATDSDGSLYVSGHTESIDGDISLNNGSIDVSHLSAGVYIVRLPETGQVFRFVKADISTVPPKQ
jgi:hypothetical protein